MLKGIRFVTVLLLAFIAAVAIADDQVKEEAEKYDKTMCVARQSNQCINEVCETSDAIDCSEKCQQEAAAKCEESERSYRQSLPTHLSAEVSL